MGENASIQYQKLSANYLDAACDVIKNTLFTTGRLSINLGIPNEPEALKELEQILRVAAKDGVTLIAIDKTKNKVVGVSFNKLLMADEPFYENLRKTFKNSKAIHILEFIIRTENICNLFEHCQIDCMMEISFLGTLPEYRKQGIAQKLCELSIDTAQKLYDGINVKESIDREEELPLMPVPKAVVAIFNQFSQGIGRKLDFEIAAQRTVESGSTYNLEFKKLHSK